MTRYRSPPHRHGAVAAAALAALLAGCAAPAPALKAWRVEPNYRITNTGPSAGPGYVALAKQYEGERRWRDASEAWRKASLEAPVDAEILNSLGTAEAGQGRYREAIAALRRAVALAPERAQLLNNLGFALLLDGLAAEATAVFRDALVRDPTHRLARANLERAEQSALASAPSSTGPTAAAPTNHMSDPARLSALGLGAQSVAHGGRSSRCNACPRGGRAAVATCRCAPANGGECGGLASLRCECRCECRRASGTSGNGGVEPSDVAA